MDNLLMGNPKAVVIYPKTGRNSNRLERNAYWSNTVQAENCQLRAESIADALLFVDPNSCDFSSESSQVAGQGLTDPNAIRMLWRRYKAQEATGD